MRLLISRLGGHEFLTIASIKVEGTAHGLGNMVTSALQLYKLVLVFSST
jgi:hypothetical protein